MRPVICFVMLFILGFPLMAQQRGYKLHGNIVQQSSGKRPVPGVIVNSLFSNQQTSGEQGEFTLTFAEAGPGSNVTITAEKDKWVIVNDKNMTLNLPDNEKFRLPVVMCEASKLEALKKEFNNITDSVIRAGYEAKLRKLDRKAEGWEKKAAELGAEMQRLYRETRETADIFARVNLDDITGTERLAFDTFRAGYLDESIRLRESMESRRKLLANKQKDLRADSTKRALDSAHANRQQENLAHIRNLHSLATEKRLKFEFAEAEKCLRTLVEYDSTSYDFVVEYADFLASQNVYDSALRWYNTALRDAVATYGNESAAKAATLHNLGNLYSDLHYLSRADSAYTQALEIRKRLSKSNPDAYEPSVAKTLNNLGILYGDLHNYPAADTAYSRSLEIRKRLAKKNPDAFEPLVAGTLNNLGILYRALNNYPAAQTTYSLALEIHKRLAKKNPDAYEPDLALTLNNLGNLYRVLHNYPAADTAYSQSLEIRKRLVKKNPDAFEPTLALVLNNLGNLYWDVYNYSGAETAYSQSLEIRKRLAKKSPDAYEPGVATTLNNLGNLYSELHNFSAADTAYTQSLDIRKRLAKNNPGAYEPDLALTLDNVGILYYYIHNYSVADTLYSQSLEIRKRLAKKNPVAYEPKLAKTLKNMSLLYDSSKNYPLAATVLSEAIELNNRLAGAGSVSYSPTDMGKDYGSLSRYLLFAHRFADAEQAAHRALIPSIVVKPAGYDTAMQWVFTNLAHALLLQRKFAEAEKIYLSLKDQANNKKTYRATFLADFDELEKAGITHPDMAKVRALLK